MNRAQFDWNEFSIGFWHPFGAHSHEGTKRILNRKQDEIKCNEWTLWSFRGRTEVTVQFWLNQLKGAKEVFALCSNSPSAVDPAVENNPPLCMNYRLLGEEVWKPIPDAVKVPHSFGKRPPKNPIASAFVVADVIESPQKEFDFTVSGYFKGSWRDQVLPRPEHLIRRGGAARLRSVVAVLRLKLPYVVWIKP